MQLETRSRALVPYGFWEQSLLHPVQLAPVRRRRKRWPIVLAVLFIVLLAAVAAACIWQFGLTLAPIPRLIALPVHARINAHR